MLGKVLETVGKRKVFRFSSILDSRFLTIGKQTLVAYEGLDLLLR